MPEQSVKQFRPYGIAAMVDEHGPINSDPWHDVMAYIERLENALDVIAQAVIFPGAYELGGVAVEYEDDGNTLKRINPPWRFFGGTGNTFLESVEDYQREDTDNA